MTSPARDYEMFEDEGAILGENPEEEEEDGEELFNDNMEAWVFKTAGLSPGVPPLYTSVIIAYVLF